MQPLLMALVLATPVGYDTLRESEGCKVSIGPATEAGPRPVRAECRWPEAQLQPARAVLLDYAAYGELVPNIREVAIRRREADRALVWQVHNVPFFAARETLVWMAATEADHGGLRVSWSPSEEALVPERGRVVAPVNQGFWEVGVSEDGGVAVIHEIAYDPGVRVPEWLVARFRTKGMLDVMGSLRTRIAGTEESP